MRLTHKPKKSVKQFPYKLGNSILQSTDSHPYLGVTITSDLKWNEHIDNITATANRTLGFIRRNLHSCSQHVKDSAYKTLVRQSLENSSSAWDPHTKILINKVESIQKRAARFVTGDYTSRSPGSMTDMLKKLNWQSLQQRRQCWRVINLQKSITGHLSLPIDSLLQPAPRTSRHTNSKAFEIIGTTKNCYKFSYFPRTIIDWNYLPELIVNLTDPESFKTAVKSHDFKKPTKKEQEEEQD